VQTNKLFKDLTRGQPNFKETGYLLEISILSGTEVLDVIRIQRCLFLTRGGLHVVPNSNCECYICSEIGVEAIKKREEVFAEFCDVETTEAWLDNNGEGGVFGGLGGEFISETLGDFVVGDGVEIHGTSASGTVCNEARAFIESNIFPKNLAIFSCHSRIPDSGNVEDSDKIDKDTRDFVLELRERCA